MTSLHGNLFSCPVTVSYWSDVVIYCTLDVWLFIQTVRNQQPANILGFTLVWVIMFELYVSKQKLKPTFVKWTGRLFSVLNEHALEDLSRLSSKSWKFFFFYVNQERKTLQEIKLNSLVCWQNIKYTQKSHVAAWWVIVTQLDKTLKVMDFTGKCIQSLHHWCLSLWQPENRALY